MKIREVQKAKIGAKQPGGARMGSDHRSDGNAQRQARSAYLAHEHSVGMRPGQPLSSPFAGHVFNQAKPYVPTASEAFLDAEFKRIADGEALAPIGSEAPLSRLERYGQAQFMNTSVRGNGVTRMAQGLEEKPEWRAFRWMLSASIIGGGVVLVATVLLYEVITGLTG